MQEIKTSDFLYIVEHQVMVEQFFSDKKEFLEMLYDAFAKNVNIVYDIFAFVAKEMNIPEVPFSSEDCSISVGQITENETMTLMVFPETDENNTTLCRFIIIVSKDDNPSDARWFTVERGAIGNDYIICEWAKDSEGELYHINYGKAPDDGAELFDKMEELFNS